MDAALRSPREFVVDDDVDVRESRERGRPRLRCFDFAADTNIAGAFIGDLRRTLASTGAPGLHTVRGVGCVLGAR